MFGICILFELSNKLTNYNVISSNRFHPGNITTFFLLQWEFEAEIPKQQTTC